MGNKDEQKSFESSFTTPLLFPYPDSVAGTSSAPSPADDQPFPPISFVRSPRPIRDIPALVSFILLSVSTFAFGFTAVGLRNTDFPHRDSFYYNPSTSSCSLDRNFQSSPYLDYYSSSASIFRKSLVVTLVLTLLLSLPFVLLLLFALRRFAKQIIYTAIPFLILVLVFFNVYWFVACQISTDCHRSFKLGYRILVLIFVFMVIGVIIWIIIVNWSRVQLTAVIVKRSAGALAANLALLLVLPFLTVALLVYFAPIVVLLVYARFNGTIVPRVEDDGRYACEWKEERWVPAYFALAIITMIWSLTTMMEAQVYVISGTIAQWYFSQEESRPEKSLRSSFRHAFGPSFGTVCFSGVICGIVRVIRGIVDSARREDTASGFVNIILQCCTKFIVSAFDFVNKFTINFAAITGEGYCSAARMTYELLRRNLLSTAFVETVSTRVLSAIIIVLSALYAIAVCAILKATTSLDLEAYLIAALAWLVLILVLGYFVHVLDNVIDTVYVCYAIDRDKGEVSKEEVHEAYVQLPLNRSYKSRSPLVV